MRVLLLSAVVGLASVSVAGQGTPFRSNVHTVAIYATVQDASGHLVTGLTKDDFQVLDNGVPAPITTFSAESVPFAATLLLDMRAITVAEGYAEPKPDLRESGPTMDYAAWRIRVARKATNVPYPFPRVGSRFLRIREASRHFVDLLGAGDRARIGSFAWEIAVSPLLTADKRALHRILDEEIWPAPQGGLGQNPDSWAPVLWAPMRTAIEAMQQVPERRVVVVISNGGSTCAPQGTWGGIPCLSYEVVRKAAELNDVMCYVIGLRPPGLKGPLAALAEDTGGGHADLDRDGDLHAFVGQVVDELHRQYAIGIRPAALDGKSHKLEVRSTRRDLKVRARKSYLAVSR